MATERLLSRGQNPRNEASVKPSLAHPTVEEEMRPAEVFVRDLSPDEGNRLKRLSKMAKHAAKRQRALICWASATGQAVPVIARLVGSHESHVRKVIHAFNERGFESLDPDYRGRRPRRIMGPGARVNAGCGRCPSRLHRGAADTLVA
jgi:Winged helix-turn helix